MVVKRVQFQEVEFSVEEGCNMPTNPNDLIAMCELIKQRPLENCKDNLWAEWDEPVEITQFDIEEANTPEGK